MQLVHWFKKLCNVSFATHLPMATAVVENMYKAYYVYKYNVT
jgi:hypothetical protein